MTFPLNVYLVAAVTACATTWATMPWWQKWCRAVGLVDDPGHRKIHDRPTPLAGGFAVMTGLLVPTLIGAIIIWFRHSGSNASVGDATQGAGLLAPYSMFLLRHGLGVRAVELAGILAGAVGMLVVGALDDKHELRAGPKFAFQMAIAALVAASGARIKLFVPYPAFHFAITIIWILTVINALNFMDNMNGLCAGLGAIGAFCFGLVAAADDQYLVGGIAFLTCGALLGFLPHNFPTARAFLGDSGSHVVGYLLAVLAILPHFYTVRHPRRWAVMIPLVVLAVPLADMAWVVVYRSAKGRPFYVGDTNHLSHRLVRAGLTKTQAVLLIWLLAALAGGLACFL